MENRPRKIPPPNVEFGVGPLPSAKHKWHIDYTLDAKIAAGEVHNGERGLHIHIVWLYSSSISQSYSGFTDFGGICSAGSPKRSCLFALSFVFFWTSTALLTRQAGCRFFKTHGISSRMM
jgi:hypothetical protein